MKSISSALKAHYASGATTLATCWKATLRDGTVLGATSHDQDIVFGGMTYLARSAYTPSDVESGSTFSPDNLELEGFLAAPSITVTDIDSGRWDYAQIEMFEVNYRDLSMGRNLVRSGTLGEVKAGDAKFTAELRGLLQAFSRTIVRVTTRECTANLGDSRCKIVLANFTSTGSVGEVLSQREIVDAARTEVDNWFAGGKFTFLTGPNASLSMEVIDSSPSGTLRFAEPFPFPIQVADTYTVHAGCAKRAQEDCIGKFNNIKNFRGFPHLPGSFAFKGPTAAR